MSAKFEVPLAVVVAVDFACGSSMIVPVALPLSATVHTLLAQLNKKFSGALGVPPIVPADDDGEAHAKLDVRLVSGAPLRQWNRTLADVGICASANKLGVIASVAKPEAAKVSAVGSMKDRRTRLGEQSEHSPQADADAGEVAPTATPKPAPGAPVLAKSVLEITEAVHLLVMDGAVRKAYSQLAVPMGGVVGYERPKLCVAYPMQLAELVRADSILRTRGFDPDMAEVPSTISGVADDDYTKYLSIALTHGRAVHTETRYDRQLAFHVKMLGIPHCCRPSCSKTVNVKLPPFTAVLRCARAGGLEQGDEVTVLLDGVNRPDFFMLPVDRRQKMLQKRYHFTCRCDRCMKSGSGPSPITKTYFVTRAEARTMSTADKEQTLSGAFWSEEAEASAALRKSLTAEMRSEFAALGIVSSDDECSLLVSNPALQQVAPEAVLAFIRKYSGDEGASTPKALTLHRNHWRLSLARMAYLRRISGPKTSGKQPLSKDTYTFAVHQLAAEALFIPDGHPHSLATYRAFKRLVALLPDKLAAEMQKTLLNEVDRDWTALRELDELVPSS